MPVFLRSDTPMLIDSLVLRMHQEIHTQPSETSEGTCLPPVLFLSPPFVLQPQQMAVQSSKFVPRVTFSLEKGRSLATVDFQAIARRSSVGCLK